MDVRYFPDMEAMSRFAAGLAADAARRAVAARGGCALVLAGGSTPRRTHELLAGAPDVPWPNVHLFLGDERCVPAGHPGSNLAMARETLIDRVPLPAANVHPIHCQADAKAAAGRYAADLEAFFQGPPAFDLVMLGMGADGHTASLFPGHASADAGGWVTAVDGRDGDPPVDRVSLTLAAVNAARMVVFLVAGQAKLELLERMAADPGAAAARWPAARVRPDVHGSGLLVWCAARA